MSILIDKFNFRKTSICYLENQNGLTKRRPQHTEESYDISHRPQRPVAKNLYPK